MDEVEKRVAAMKPGEDPGKPGWGGSPVRHKVEFRATADRYQILETLAQILTRKRGVEVTIEEAIYEATKHLMEEEIENDGKDGKERKLPSGFKLVIYCGPGCRQYAVATADGPMAIPEERARELTRDAEVLDLTEPCSGEDLSGSDRVPDLLKILASSRNGNGCSRNESPEKCQGGDGEKRPTWVIVKTEVVENPPSPSGGIHPAEGAKNPSQMDPGEGRKKSPALVKHAPNLTTSRTPRVPREDRDPPNSRKVREEVMSRDGYRCRNTGCDNICDECNHTEERSCGGPSTRENNGSFCKPCHNGPIHGQKSLLVSGTGDHLILSDSNLRPLTRRPSDEETSIELEVERPPENPEGEIEEELLENAPENQQEESAATVAPPGMRLVEFLGQREVVEGLSIAIQAERARGELPRPILLAGPPGLGKTTLARSIAREFDGRLHITCGPNLTDPAVLRGVLSGLGKNEILFIDEIHRMPHAVAECLYQALDDGTLSVTVETEVGHRAESRKLEPFLLVGATTEESLLPRPLHSRFSLKQKLHFYSSGDLEEIVRREGEKLEAQVSPEGARILAGGSRGTPRQLISNLHQARDVAQIRKGAPGEVNIDAETARRALDLQGIDSQGLDRMDRKILQVLVERARPMGLRTLADLAGENRRTIAEIHEPYLLRKGLMARTHRGRVATEKARRLFTFRVIA